MHWTAAAARAVLWLVPSQAVYVCVGGGLTRGTGGVMTGWQTTALAAAALLWVVPSQAV